MAETKKVKKVKKNSEKIEMDLKQDGCLYVGSQVTDIIFHSNLNVMLVFGQSNGLKVLDINSGVILQSTVGLAGSERKIAGKYLPQQDKVLFWDGKNIGMRGDYNGVLFLETILQTPVKQTDDIVKLEILLSEAVLFLQSLQNIEEHGLENTSDVINEFVSKITEANSMEKKGIKAQKWNTICLELPHSYFKMVANNVVFQLKKLDRHIPALAIASAISERLTDLRQNGRMLEAVNASGNSQRYLMYSEATRRQTFLQWPHMDYKWALPNQMAQAGFYHQPVNAGDDRAMCFTCNVCLVCWEKTDEPWSEHERHSPSCPFVKGEYTQNVPLAITSATNPATATTGFTIMSNGIDSNMTCTGNVSGEVELWKTKWQVLKIGSFNLREHVQFLRSSLKMDELNETDIELHALCTIPMVCANDCKSENNLRIVCGISIKSKEYLIVYNIIKLESKQQSDEANDRSEKEESKDNNKDDASSKKSTLKNIVLEDEYSEDDIIDLSYVESSESCPYKNMEKLFMDETEELLSEDESKAKIVNAETPAISSNVSTLTEAITCVPIQLLMVDSHLVTNFSIVDIVPSYDKKYLLIVLKNTLISQSSSDSVPIDVDGDVDTGHKKMDNKNEVLLVVFEVKDTGLEAIPTVSRWFLDDNAPTQICMLPNYIDKISNDNVDANSENVFAMICQGGKLLLISLLTLSTISDVSEYEKFVTVTYCKNLERICASTSSGMLHFYSFFDVDLDSADDHEDDKVASLGVQFGTAEGDISETDGLNKGQPMPSTSNSPPGAHRESAHCAATYYGPSAVPFYAYKLELTPHDLKSMYALTLFDPILTQYSAEVPACWNELIQAQKQRRPSQQLRAGDNSYLTKTWRLHNDATTWDEHIIEITLPKAASLGHIDLRFTLYQQCPNPPAIQITLLKQNTTGFGYRMKTPCSSGSGACNASSTSAAASDSIRDKNDDFKVDFGEFKENPVLSEDYLQAHNADILAGPIELASCMDLNEDGGLVTLTSPKLFKTKSRNFLLHIKTMADVSKNGHGKTRVPVRKKGILRYLFPSFAKPSSQISANSSLSQDCCTSKATNNEFYIGCDWLHELSISLRSTQNAYEIPNERLQRIAMLESNVLLKNLLQIISNSEINSEKMMALDILQWVITIRLARYRSPIPDGAKKQTSENVTNMHLQQIECVTAFQYHLSNLLRSCILGGNRTSANKCVKIVLTALEGVNNMLSDRFDKVMFEKSLRNAILDCLPDLVFAKYSGALRWFTLLVSTSSTFVSQSQISEACLNLLLDVTKEMAKRSNQYTSMLRTRFGLYGLPFEPDLFDAELPLIAKYNSSPNTFSSIIIKNAPATQQQNTIIDLKKFCSPDGNELRTFPSQIRRKGISNQIRGILEVEPLHFTCCAASEATRVENMDSAAANQANNIIDDILFDAPPQNNEQTVNMNNIDHSTKSTKIMTAAKPTFKNHQGEMNNIILLDKIFSSSLIKHKAKIMASNDKNKENNYNYFENFPVIIKPIDSKFNPFSIESTEKSNIKPSPRVPKVDTQKTNPSKSVVASKLQEIMSESMDESNAAYPWHKLLSLPTKQMVVIDRMHSGARRFITLNFGYLVKLTDVIIPACEDLVSIAIDVWCLEEEVDATRLAMATDINTKTLVLTDLQPPPLCRFMKITTTGRYGMSATRCKIPIGSFFGHVVVDDTGYSKPAVTVEKPLNNNITMQLKALHSLYEDVHCRYSLSRSKLMELLDPLFNSYISNVAHMQAYLNKNMDPDNISIDHTKILNVYEECIGFQHQLNIIQNVLNRVDPTNNLSPTSVKHNNKIDNLSSVSSDKLRVLSECLVEMLMHFLIEYGVKNVFSLHTFFDVQVCNTLFDTLIVSGDNNMQLATCALIVRMCSFQPWWGDFLASCFTKLYSSQNTKIFPQDRVFFLLTYLGRKSIAMGSCRIVVIDSILKTLATLLVPLSNSIAENLDVTGSKTDFQLISWLLLFLSVCIDDGVDKKDQNAIRWDFMSGDADVSKTQVQSNPNYGRTFARSFKKRFFQNKQTSNNNSSSFLDKIMTTQNEKRFHVAQLKSQIEMVLKQQENLIKRNVKIHQITDMFSDINGKSKAKSNKSDMPSKAQADDNDKEQSFDKGLRSLKISNTLVVIRGLVSLLLAMDYTCNMDLFLLTCKILARLVSACQPAIQLSKIITKPQLQQLVRLAVWRDQQQPWAVHAITCLLQDILDADRNFKLIDCCDDDDDEDAVTADSAEMEVVQDTSDVAGASENDLFNDAITEGLLFSPDDSNKDSIKFSQLPSLAECEDADMDDMIIDDILECGKNMSKNDNNTFVRSGLNNVYRSVSCAMDARLESGLESNIETNLRKLTMMSSLNLFASLPQSPNYDFLNRTTEILPWPEYILQAWSDSDYREVISTNQMLVMVFDSIFADLHLQDSWLHLDQVLQLWLTLYNEMNLRTPSTNPFSVNLSSESLPKLPFGTMAVQGLLSALSWDQKINLRTWCLGFQCLTLACTPLCTPQIQPDFDSDESSDSNSRRMGVLIVNDPNFEKMLQKFYSSTDMSSNDNRCAGPTICKLINELFMWMELKSDVNDVCYVKKKLKEILLRVVLQLVQPGGAISMQQGPMDAQSLLIQELISCQYEKADQNVGMSIIESVSHLVYNHITNIEKVHCQRLVETQMNNVFGSLFATVLGSEGSRQNKTGPVSGHSLLVCLLKLSSKIVQTALPQLSDTMETNDLITSQNIANESQTDEIKAEQQQNQVEVPIVKVPCIADTVLQHYPTMFRLLGSLSHSTSTSFALLASTISPAGLTDNNNPISGDPSSVADAVFQILMLLSYKGTQSILIVKPLYDFLNSTSSMKHAMPRLQLSEPFLWFILQILEIPATVAIFTDIGGIKVLCQNLVRCNRTLVNMQPGLVSLIMQHISKSPKQKTSNTAAAVSPNTCKKATAAQKSVEGYINFAPFCSISTENSTAQPPDVLVLPPIASHRRARTAAWSYLFYPNESHIDLNITLPTAILLKEIQLQPHLPSLQSCPSAVAIEINRESSMIPIPLCHPMSTEGLTYIRLRLPQPEVATSIVLRLYRPKDSTNIGLTQISVLGTTVFSKNSPNDLLPNDEETTAKTSLGWLRILHRCFSVAAFNPNNEQLRKSVIDSTAEYPGFLEACCSLLNVVGGSPSVALQNTETVLLKLGLHSKELGLKLINNLLMNTIPQPFRLCNESVSDLLFELCTTYDEFTYDRIASLINWTKNLHVVCQLQVGCLKTNPFSGFVKCLASILWTVHSSPTLSSIVTNLITEDLFESIFLWTELLDSKDPMKKSVDAMLCSICYIRPEFFLLLLKKLNVLVPNLSTKHDASISDDRKETERMTDDTKQETSDMEEWYSHLVIEDLTKLNLSSHQLSTISMACQSLVAINQLLDSGLPKLLSFAILEFCYRASSKETLATTKMLHPDCLTDSDKVENRPSKNVFYPMVNMQKVSEILDFFSETCSEGHMRDWLGTYEGSVFWNPLLDLLCNDRPVDTDPLSNCSKLEAATIRFLSKVTSCHPKNQEYLTIILISVIKKPNNPQTSKNIISGFTRRLVLQLLLESERILVSVQSDIPLQKRDPLQAPFNNHPALRPTAQNIFFYLSTHAKCKEILDNSMYNNLVTITNTNCDATNKRTNLVENQNVYMESRKDWLEFGMGLGSGISILSVAAGVTAKDKRLKEAKNQVAALKDKDFMPSLFNKIKNADNFITTTDVKSLIHLSNPEVVINSDTTISQVLAMLHNSGVSLATPCISLKLTNSNANKAAEAPTPFVLQANDIEPLPSPLQVFSSRGGLSLLAHYLPTVYPEIPKTLLAHTETEKAAPVSDWVKVEPNDDIYEDLDNVSTDSSSKLPLNLSVPQHSLAAFGLFLRLPAYSDVLLRDKIRAQCLLRLVLGVTGDGEGNDIYSLALAATLPTLPFEVFRQLLNCSPLTTDDGVILRRMIIEVGAMHLVLNCLGIFTHHSQMYQLTSSTGLQEPPANGAMKTAPQTDDQLISDDKSHMYWAKGTGFGTGSTQQSWDVEQALLRQKSEEEHVTVLLQILSSYINPGDCTNIEMSYHESSDDSSELPPIFLDLLQHSCLIPALCSYLRNDSVLDITRHIPLYRAILLLLRAMALSNRLVTLLMPSRRNDMSIATLLVNMKLCVDTYASRLKVNKKSNIKGQTQKVIVTLDDGDDEGLALLIPDIHETTLLVHRVTNIDKLYNSTDDIQTIDQPLSKSIEERYLEIMKKLQFDTAEMIVESDTGYRFIISHHFENNVRNAGDRSHPTRVKRLAQETVTLSTSLPLSYSSSVFVRCDTDRLDIMKVLITGPADTPYANGCFEFDVYFPPDYPTSPMMINLETTGRNTVRFNPNLYNDGKVCLSVLNTWHGRPEEKWNAQTSSFLQVLVSIQSLILVPEPYFNEPGFERSRGSPSATHTSREYNSTIYQACVRWAMLQQIISPCPCFKEVIHTHFWLKRHEICTQIEEWIAEVNQHQQTERSGRSVAFNSLILKRLYTQLREELAKLPVPPGLEDLDQPFTVTSSSTCDSTAATPTNIPLTSSSTYFSLNNSAVTSVLSLDTSSSSSDSNTTPNII